MLTWLNAELVSELISDLIFMTPLSWGITKDRIEKLLELNSLEVTIDLKIILGQNR
ncbi:hypothetical protein ACPUYX_10675 [Desulfosporosinus sp. SYSU MS00001]|uniref:hypothetical protein n=1 Tax=Desulfosporosinus sp. SYSU MS00001 TaxID=3416284 RepID=UPI003CF43BFB